MNENIKLLCDDEIHIEIYRDNAKVWCYIVVDHGHVRGTGEHFPITCIADISNALDQVLVDIVKHEMQKLEEE